MKLHLELDLDWRVWLRGQRLLRVILGLVLFVLMLHGQPNELEWTVGVYAVVAIVLGFEGSWSYVLAIILLFSVPLMLLLGLSQLADNYAVYCFYFLALGAAGNLFEVAGGSSDGATMKPIFSAVQTEAEPTQRKSVAKRSDPVAAPGQNKVGKEIALSDSDSSRVGQHSHNRDK